MPYIGKILHKIFEQMMFQTKITINEICSEAQTVERVRSD